MTLQKYGGETMHRSGEYLREYLVREQELLSGGYETNEVYVQTPSEQRTIDSAKAHLDGLYHYPLQQWSPDGKDGLWTINTMSAEDDWLLQAHKICPRYSEMQGYAIGLMDRIERENESSGYYGTLRNLAGLPDADAETLNNLSEYII